MIAIAAMSSTIAIVSRNSLAPAGTRSPSSASTPIAKAMSVAAGSAQPAVSPLPAVIARNSSAGSATPPAAAIAGRSAARAVAQLAGDQLALDLQPDDEEEHRHQPVVDPMTQVQVQAGEIDAGVPEGLVAAERDVGPHQRRDGADEERDAADGLVVQELPQRARPPHAARQ